MDSSIPITEEQLERLNDKDKGELRALINNEAQKARVQAAVHSVTDMCWSKCITGNIKQGKLDRAEESCMTNCAGRFLDANSLALKHLQNLLRE